MAFILGAPIFGELGERWVSELVGSNVKLCQSEVHPYLPNADTCIVLVVLLPKCQKCLCTNSVLLCKLSSVNPPAPVPCPIRGRYSFTQIGLDEEKYTTRVQDISPRPQPSTNCFDYVSEFKSCDVNPNKIIVDTEYCSTLDDTGKPIGENSIYSVTFHCLSSDFKYSFDNLFYHIKRTEQF